MAHAECAIIYKAGIGRGAACGGLGRGMSQDTTRISHKTTIGGGEAQACRLLLVNIHPGDFELIRTLLQEAKEAAEFLLRPATSLEEALRILNEGETDLVLLALDLPVASGLAAIDGIRKSVPDVPVVVLTGLQDDEISRRVLQKGAQDYIVKSTLDPGLLVRTLRHAVERNRIQRELEYANQRLERLAVLDPLTEVLNRRGLQEALAKEIYRARRTGPPLMAFVLDLDDFKKINDHFGHTAGDIILTEIAARLKDSTRTSDQVGRIGGDEFIVLLPGIRLAEAERMAERVRLAISQNPISMFSGRNVNLTASVAVGRGKITKN